MAATKKSLPGRLSQKNHVLLEIKIRRVEVVTNELQEVLESVWGSHKSNAKKRDRNRMAQSCTSIKNRCQKIRQQLEVKYYTEGHDLPGPYGEFPQDYKK